MRYSEAVEAAKRESFTHATSEYSFHAVSLSTVMRWAKDSEAQDVEVFGAPRDMWHFDAARGTIWNDCRSEEHNLFCNGK